MVEEHGASVEKVGIGLICSVETYKKGNIRLVKRTSGFNGLSTYFSGEVRKIEVKTMQKSDYWIAINGFTAIDKLFFDRDYWLYFALIPENIIVMAKALPFIKNQLKLSDKFDFLKDLEEWIKSTKKLSGKSGLKFIPRINIKFNYPIRKLIKTILDNDSQNNWDKSLIEIWQNMGEWKCLYSKSENNY